MVRFKCGYGEGMYEDKQGEYVAYKEVRKLISEAKRSQVEAKVKVNFADFKMGISLLRDLADLQNGAPLVTYEKEWQRTMDNIYVFLNEHESKISA